MKKILTILFIFLFVFYCKKLFTPSIIGSWETNVEKSTLDVNWVLVFNEDGTGTLSDIVKGEHDKYNWMIKDKLITFSFKEDEVYVFEYSLKTHNILQIIPLTNNQKTVILNRYK